MKFFWFIVLSIYLSATEITLEFLQSKPKGIARDFYIWRYLQNPKISLENAIKAYDLIYKKNPKLEDLLAKKGYTHELPREVACKKLPFEKLKQEDGKCIAYGLKLSIIPSISENDSIMLIRKLQQKYPTLVKKIQILRSKKPLEEILKIKNAKIFSEIFYALNTKQRMQIFDQYIDPKVFSTFANQNNATFNKMIQYILLSDHFSTFKQNILSSQITQASEKILLLLGIMHTKFNQIPQAKQYFTLILKNPRDRLNRDKALFWQYLLTKDQEFLYALTKSRGINLYTIYANQKLKTKFPFNIESKILNLKNEQPNFNIYDPFEWQILFTQIKQIPDVSQFQEIVDQNFYFKKTEPHLAIMLNQIQKYKINYFLMPYDENIIWDSDHQKALTYAIAKQESNLLPALVSSSYALGMMQIMPFNLKPFAKALGKENTTLDDLFNPSVALEFGRFYLAELEREFKHPLFVAYAYNGGPNFLKRTLKKKTLFIKDREYEPWLSLELIPYEESKNYGQIVLANYIIYQQILGKEIDLQSFLKETLVN